jgi:hypothetical protein
MKFHHVMCVLAAIALLPFAAAEAKKPKAKARGGNVTGVYCAQGPDNAHFPISMFKPAQRARMYKGQKAKINIAGFGPVDCLVY